MSITGLNATLFYSGPPELDYFDNAFTLQANTNYYLYLFGIGDNNGQNSTFTLLPSAGTIVGSATGTTSGTLPSSADGGHFVKFEFTTPADLTNYDLRFNWESTGTFTALNGAVLTPVPEPGVAGLVSLSLLAFLGRLRRKIA